MSSKYKSSSVKSSGSALGGSANIIASKEILPLHYGGLGARYFEQLSTGSDAILQVDTIHNITETKGSIKTRATRLAIEMKARGIGKNDIILISSKTHAHQTIALLATLFLGAIVSPVGPESPHKECVDLLSKLKPKMCFCDSRTASQVERILSYLHITSEIVCFGSDVAGTTEFSKLIPFKEDTNFKPFFIDNPHKEVAFIIPTQGSCHEPKLVCLSHHNIFLQCVIFMEIFNNPSRVISFFPLSWLIQTVVACTSLEYGVTRIMTASFNERIACKVIHDFVIDLAVLGTELALRLTGNTAVKDFNLNCLKCVLVGVINTSKDNLHQMRKALPNVMFLQVYSLTETGFVSGVNATHYSKALEKSRSVGKLLKNSRIKIVDLETKQPVEVNQMGELLFFGDGLMLGYFKDNTATAEAFEKKYFKTGDLARYDDDGWLYLDGRIDDIICYKNESFMPTQLEQYLASHPLVHSAVIIGKEDELFACIETKPDTHAVLNTDKLMMYLSKKMPEFSDSITIRFFDEFPRTNAGHIIKRALRAQILEVKIEYTRSLASIGPLSSYEVEQI